MDKVSYVGNADVNAIDHLYKQYCQDPESVDIGWKKFFEGFDFARTNYEDNGEIPENFQKEFKVLNLINGYRTRGHLFTKTNPVRDRRKYKRVMKWDWVPLPFARSLSIWNKPIASPLVSSMCTCVTQIALTGFEARSN
jgi:2-oxoglutarate dehydrogenase complex dehydrogenase (E1) component-like enzyme